MEYEYKGTERTIKSKHSENGELLSFDDTLKVNWEEKKYRIVERVGKFYIQILYKRKKGIIHRREVEEWFPIDINGHTYLSGYQTRMQSFLFLDDAKKVIESIKKGVVIHEL